MKPLNPDTPDDETREWVRALFTPDEPDQPKPTKASGKPLTEVRPGILSNILNLND